MPSHEYCKGHFNDSSILLAEKQAKPLYGSPLRDRVFDCAESRTMGSQDYVVNTDTSACSLKKTAVKEMTLSIVRLLLK